MKPHWSFVTRGLQVLVALAAVVTATAAHAQPAPDLVITKTHTGSFLQGQVSATYTLTVSNVGSGPTSLAVTMSDTLPAGLTPTAAAGAGWVCNIAAQNVSCSRSDALNGGTSYPPITLTVNVSPAAPPSLTNTVMVSGGGESNTANNVANDITTIGPGPDLVVTKGHAGNFVQGQTGAIYTIMVRNTGSAPTSGVVTVTDNLPAGVIPTSATGSGWTCSVAGQDATCTRSDPLAPGASYPAITLTVNVQSGAPASVTNSATVSGGGDVNPANNSASDPTTIVPGADLTIIKSHTGDFTQGQPGIHTITVSNVGGSPTAGPVTVTDLLPAALLPNSAAGPGWSCSISGQDVACTRGDPLAPGGSYPAITLTVNVALTAPSSLSNTASVSGGGDANSANNAANDVAAILAGADLAITKTHTGTFVQGQAGATYTITATNHGGAPTSGVVILTDMLPAGLTATAVSGAGWTCSVATVTCTRSDALPPGSSYPAVTVTVDVAPLAPPSITNTATVSGDGDVNPANDSASDPTAIAAAVVAEIPLLDGPMLVVLLLLVAATGAASLRVRARVKR